MMDISVWKSNQSMETKGVCILLMNDDLTCNKFATQMLQHYTYEVLQIGDVSGVLNAIHKMKDRLELVLTNAYLSEPDGDSVVQYIQSNINLPIALMDPDKSQMLPKGQTCSFTAYVLNGLRREEIAKLQKLALQNAKGKMVTIQDQNAQQATGNIDAIEKKDCPTVSETTRSNKIKRHDEKNESGEDESPIQKKGRVHWSTEMHKKFLEAIEIIGYDRAVPKKIVEVMNIPGLTRENVASHLQKHRENIKREIALGSIPANGVNEFKLSPFMAPISTTCLNASRNSYFMQGSYNMPPLQQKPFVSHALNRQCLKNPQNRISCMPTTERNNFPNLSNLQSQPKFVPKFQSNRNFRIYSDQTKNVLVSVNRGNASNQTANYKFVGLKLTNEGNKIQFGENGTSQIQFTNYDQQNLVPEQNNPSTTTVFVSQEPSLLEDILSQYDAPQEIENQAQVPITPLDGMSLEQHVLQPFVTSGDEKTKTVPDQSHNDRSNEALKNFEQETIDIPSTFVPDQDFLSPWLDILNNDTSTSIEGSSEKHFSRPLEINEFIEQEEIDRVLQNGMGNASSEVDWDELDNSLFAYDY